MFLRLYQRRRARRHAFPRERKTRCESSLCARRSLRLCTTFEQRWPEFPDYRTAMPSYRIKTASPRANTLQAFPSPHTQNIYNSLHEGDIVSYDSFAVLRGDRIPPHVKDGREMVDAVAAWALPSTLSLIPADVLLAAVGALMCEYQV